MGALPRRKPLIRCTYGGMTFCPQPATVVAFRPFVTRDGGTYSPVCDRHAKALVRRGGKIVTGQEMPLSLDK